MFHVTGHQGNANENMREPPPRIWNNGQNLEPRQHQTLTGTCSDGKPHSPLAGTWGGPLGRQSAVSDKSAHTLTHNPAITLRGVYPKELKSQVHTWMHVDVYGSCTWMSTAALFIIAETWEQRRCPSAGEWINKPSPSRQRNMTQH